MGLKGIYRPNKPNSQPHTHANGTSLEQNYNTVMKNGQPET